MAVPCFVYRLFIFGMVAMYGGVVFFESEKLEDANSQVMTTAPDLLKTTEPNLLKTTEPNLLKTTEPPKKRVAYNRTSGGTVGFGLASTWIGIGSVILSCIFCGAFKYRDRVNNANRPRDDGRRVRGRAAQRSPFCARCCITVMDVRVAHDEPIPDEEEEDRF